MKILWTLIITTMLFSCQSQQHTYEPRWQMPSFGQLRMLEKRFGYEEEFIVENWYDQLIYEYYQKLKLAMTAGDGGQAQVAYRRLRLLSSDYEMTPLLWQIMNGNIKTVEKMLTEEPNLIYELNEFLEEFHRVSSTSDDWEFFSFGSLKHAQLQHFRSLAEKYLTVEYDERFYLREALQLGDLDAAERFYQEGRKMTHIVNGLIRHPMGNSSSPWELSIALNSEDPQLVRWMLDHGASRTGMQLKYDIIDSIRMNYHEANCSKVLIETHKTGLKGFSNLAYDLHETAADLMELFIENHYDFNSFDRYGDSPLMELCRDYPSESSYYPDSPEQAQWKLGLLLKSGAKVDVRDNLGRNSLHELMETLDEGTEKMVLPLIEILLQAGADINALSLEDELSWLPLLNDSKCLARYWPYLKSRGIDLQILQRVNPKSYLAISKNLKSQVDFFDWKKLPYQVNPQRPQKTPPAWTFEFSKKTKQPKEWTMGEVLNYRWKEEDIALLSDALSQVDSFAEADEDEKLDFSLQVLRLSLNVRHLDLLAQKGIDLRSFKKPYQLLETAAKNPNSNILHKLMQLLKPNLIQAQLNRLLHLATAEGSATCMTYLINAGADAKSLFVESRNPTYDTLLEFLDEEDQKERVNLLTLALESENPKCIKIALKHINFAQITTEERCELLDYYPSALSEQMTQKLLQANAHLQEEEDATRLPLHSAISYLCEPEDIELLIEQGADIEAINTDEKTALQTVIEGEYIIPYISTLLKHGAKLHFPKNYDAWNIYAYIFTYHREKQLLQPQVKQFHRELLRTNNKGYDALDTLIQDDAGQSALDLLQKLPPNLITDARLHEFCRLGRKQGKDFAHGLVKQKSSTKPNFTDDLGNALIHYGCEDYHDLISAIELGADINLRNGEGQTALHLAAAKRRYRLTEILLKAGAKPSLKNTAGKTAADIARNKGHLQLIPLLHSSK